MADNLFTLPKIQTPSRQINQIQDNIKTQVNQGLQNAVSASSAIGQVIGATLTEAQLQAQLGLNWVMADGRTAIGTQYNLITGKNTIPTISPVGSVNYFIRVN